jgi:hypothetical protein
MDRRNNILAHLIRNEKGTTELLYALLTYKPFRNALLRLLTKGKAETDGISWDDMYTQTEIGGGIPDLSILGETTNILVEVKITSWRGLTDNQPQTYLQWLAAQGTSKAGYFVAIIPPVYYHLQELKQRITSFNNSNALNPIISTILTWDEVLKMLRENDLDQMNPYIRDFCDLLASWYEIPITKFTFDEVDKMYDADTAKAIRKLMKVVEDVVNGLEQKGYKVEYSFNKKWWDDGEYGAYVKHGGDQYLLWFGLWQDYWEKMGEPLCFGVQDREWDARICTEFMRIHPNYTKYPPNSPKPFLGVGIKKDILLSEDPVTRILDILEKDLRLLSEQFGAVEKA